MRRQVPKLTATRYSRRLKRKELETDVIARPDPKLCAFLSLAPELRNSIYELVLIEEDYVEVNSSLKEPGLLSTCKQIRSESRNLWLASNNFYHRMVDCDAIIMGRFKRWVENQKPLPLMSLSHMHGRPHWANLEYCCKEVHSGRSFGVSPPSSETAGVDRDMDAVARGAVSLAVNMVHLSWEECNAALMSFRYVAGRIDKRWLLD